MIDYSAIESSLCSIYSQILPTHTAIVSSQNAPRPAKPYLTCRIQSITKSGDDVMYNVNGQSGVASFCGNRDVSVSVQLFGDGAISDADTLATMHESPIIQKMINDEGFYFVSCEQINDITGILDREFEPRAEITINYRMAQDTAGSGIGADVGAIDTAIIDETINTQNQTIETVLTVE